MAKVIKGTDIIESGALNEHIKQLQDAKKAYDALDKSVDNLNKSLKQSMTGNKGMSAAEIEKMNVALQKSTNLRKASVESQKQQQAISKQLAAAQDEEVKGKLRLQQATAKQKAELKDLLVLENKEAGTLQKLAAENRKLRREREGLNLETSKGQKRLTEINRALDANNAKIKASSDAMKQQRMNVGAYGKAVSKVTTILKGFGATMIAAFSFQAIKGFFTSSVDAFRVQEKAVAKVEQAVKSTGGAAGKTSEELQKMASALQKNTLFGDEQILNEVTAQLLTFTNISGTQFDRTQQVALDLATVLDGDLKSASIQLGKALNDPIANLSALSRSGIQFSSEQKELIKTLAESGRLAEAQGVILTELERQYGGQAAAAAEVDGGITQLNNAFGDFKEQVGKQLLEAMKPTIQSLKEFFENLSEDDVKKFVDTLFTLVSGIKSVVLALGSYKLAAGAAAKVNQVFGKSLPTKAFGALGVAIYAAYEIFQGFVDIYESANLESNKFKEIQKEIVKEVDKEAAKVQLLGQKLMQLNPHSKERADLIEQINAEYGTTLKNIDDETVMINQLTVAYENYVKQLEKKIGMRVIEEQLVDAMTSKLELERKIQEEGGVISNAYAEGLERTNNTIKSLQAELFRLQNQQEDLGITAKTTSDIIKKDFNKSTDESGKSVKKVKEEVKDEREEIEKLNREIERLSSNADKFETLPQFQGRDPFTDAMLAANEKIAEDRRKRLEELKKMRDETLAIFKEITDGLVAEIDKRIDARKQEIDAAQNEISRLQSLAAQGDANAAKAIKAEQVRVAKEKIEIERLQKKKRNLLITVTALERVSQNIGSGDPNPFKSAGKSMTEFLDSLPTFFKGTDMTVADALGHTGVKDGHTVRVHDNEHIIGSKDSDSLHRAGFKKTKDIVNAAMLAQNLGLAGRAVKNRSGADHNSLLVSEIKGLRTEFKEAISQIETTKIDPEKLFATITKGNTVKNITHKKGFRFE